MNASSTAWSSRFADSFVSRYPLLGDHPHISPRWQYENGCMLKAMERMHEYTGDERYFRYIQTNMDRFIREDGSIDSYTLEDYNLDQICQGKTLFLLHAATGQSKYAEAAERLIVQLKGHPRTEEGGFWHKKVYPYQMWLDGLYMASPFMAQYAKASGDTRWYDEAAEQLVIMEKRARDPRTGLLYHAYDESREQRWADPETGRSPHFWGRALGWYMMALTDVLDCLPVDHPRRGLLCGIFERLAHAVAAVQDPESGLWHQVLDQGGREGNYVEATGSCMFVYALARGVRQRYITRGHWKTAEKGWAGLVGRLIKTDAEGNPRLTQCVAVSGLGGNPYRDGSYEYYVGEPVRDDDAKGLAPLIMAALEIEAGPDTGRSA